MGEYSAQSLFIRARKGFRHIQFNTAIPKTSPLGAKCNARAEESTVLLRRGEFGVGFAI